MKRSRPAVKPYGLVGRANPVLHQPAEPVTDFGPELAQVVERMTLTLDRHRGYALAAPQVGIGLRLVVLARAQAHALLGSRAGVIAMANPEIEPAHAGTAAAVEACLSIPSRNFEVERATKIRWRSARIEDGEMCDWVILGGFEARVIQHEVDHLNGVLVCDHGRELTQRQVKARG